MRADGTIGICDRHRTFENRLECLTDIKPLRLAADQHRYRLQFAGDLAGRIGRHGRAVSAAAAASRADVAASSFDCRSALAASHCNCSSATLAAACALASSACCFCFRRDAGAELALDGRQLGLGPALEVFRRANRRLGLRGLPLGCRRRRVRASAAFLVASCASVVRAAASAAAPGFGWNSSGWAISTRRHIVRRHDHADAHLGRVEQLFGKVEGQADAAMGRRTSRQDAAMQRDARPGDALHVRHEGVVIQVRVVLLDLLDDAENAGGRLAPLRAARTGARKIQPLAS